MITLVAFVLILSILVFVHEFGHFIVARKMGVKVEEFGLGLPPRLAGFYRGKDGKIHFVWGKKFSEKDFQDIPGTLYSLNWIPLGGFCRIKGENGEAAQDKDSFGAKKIWQRLAIVSAGVAMNFLLAAVLLAIGFIIGIPQAGHYAGATSWQHHRIQIVSVIKGSPADKAGLRPGDIIIGLDKKKFSRAEDLSHFIAQHNKKEITLIIKRGNKVFSVQARPEIIKGFSHRPLLGIEFEDVGIVSYPWYKAIYKGFWAAFVLTGLILQAFGHMIVSLWHGASVGNDITGPIGIAVLTKQAVNLGFIYVLQFMVLLSLNLAIINFLPFPALDGGRAVLLVLEKIRGKALPVRLEARINNTGFALLLLLVLLITLHDISRFREIFIHLGKKIIKF